jgi:hypothetical protein
MVQERLHKTLELLKKELLQLKLQKKISKQVEDKVNTMQREVMLREQLKVRGGLEGWHVDWGRGVGLIEEVMLSHCCADDQEGIRHD